MRRRVLALLVLPAACSSGEETSAPDGGLRSLEISDFCASLAEAECERLEACGLLARPLSPESCAVRVEQVLCAPLLRAFSSEVERGALRYDEIQAVRCRDEIRGESCEVGLEHQLLSGPECSSVVSGRVAAGDACRFSFSCEELLFCDANPDRCPGTCRAPRSNNETCSIEEWCQQELYCAATAMRCRARVARGQSCEPSLGGNSCVEGSYCDFQNLGGPVCVGVRGRGSGCSSPYECASGLACLRSRCSAGEEGDTCLDHGDCLGLGVCVSGTCRTPVPPEGECAKNGVPCSEGFVCTSSVTGMLCAPKVLAGDPCESSLECYLSRCLDGVCRPLVSDGGSCAQSEDCLPGRSCSEGHCAISLDCSG